MAGGGVLNGEFDSGLQEQPLRLGVGAGSDWRVSGHLVPLGCATIQCVGLSTPGRASLVLMRWPMTGGVVGAIILMVVGYVSAVRRVSGSGQTG